MKNKQLGRCQGMTAFRPVFGTYGGLMGDIKDRMRYTNQAKKIIKGVELCGLHAFNEETIRFHTINAWSNEK